MAALRSAQAGVNAPLASALHSENIGSYFWCPLGLSTRVSIHLSMVIICFAVQHKSMSNDIFQQQLLVRRSEVCVPFETS